MNAIDRLYEILKSCPDEVSKSWVIKERDKLKPLLDEGESTCGDPLADPSEDNGLSDVTAPLPTETQPFSALLLTPSASDMSRMLKPYLTASEPFCLRLSEQRAEGAVLMMLATVGQIAAVADKLPCWGFARFSQIWLLSAPSGPAVFEEKAIAVSEWGKKRLAKPLSQWPDAADPLRVAEIVLDSVSGRRVHLFAKKQTPGWEAVIGEANWSTGPDSNG